MLKNNMKIRKIDFMAASFFSELLVKIFDLFKEEE